MNWKAEELEWINEDEGFMATGDSEVDQYVDEKSGWMWSPDDEILINPGSDPKHWQCYDHYTGIWWAMEEYQETPDPDEDNGDSGPKKGRVKTRATHQIPPPVLVPGYEFPWDNSIFAEVRARDEAKQALDSESQTAAEEDGESDDEDDDNGLLSGGQRQMDRQEISLGAQPAERCCRPLFRQVIDITRPDDQYQVSGKPQPRTRKREGEPVG
ncbi:hypothetical protein EDD37DRAFT_644491 [Exophiala viscosa]|uniref:uncharacterized protein n=1 Tax=Exophiala viscosa TaxID=2486360 RepID=UPI0021A1D802|nr:hypothetical protein EDD37DRAFT_644491 [Exophiala viscosa]